MSDPRAKLLSAEFAGKRNNRIQIRHVSRRPIVEERPARKIPDKDVATKPAIGVPQNSGSEFVVSIWVDEFRSQK